MPSPTSLSISALAAFQRGSLGLPDAEMDKAMRVARTILRSASAACRVMNTASARHPIMNTAAACDQPARQGRRRADQGTERPRRASDAARPARHSANSAPVAAMRHGKPMLLTMSRDSRLHRKTARQGASACAGAVRFDKVSPGCSDAGRRTAPAGRPNPPRRTRPAAAGTRCARSSRFPAASPRPGRAAPRSPRHRLPRRPAGRRSMTRTVARHMTMRTPSEGSAGEIEPVRLKPRSSAVMPRPSSTILGSPVGTMPSPPTVPISTAATSACVRRGQPVNANCRRYSQPIKGSSNPSCSHNEISAARVPVIRMATMTSPVLKASNADCALWRDRASSSAANGRVQTVNSAKKLRLTKVEAGCGPCGKKPRLTQNCSTAHSDATAAPPWIPQASSGRRSRARVLRPSHSSRAKMNQRMASTPARKVCDQAMLPNA